MLPDFKQLLYSPLRHRHLHVLQLQATFTGGAATVDTANSAPNFSIGAAAGGGVYPLTFPKGTMVHGISVTVDPNSTAPAAGTPVEGFFNALSASGGTGNVVFTGRDGTLANPGNGSRCYITMLLGKI